jgi:aspartate/methionine/tyrosine aminotransferase
VLALIARQAKDSLVTRNLKIIENNLELLDAFMLRRSKCFAWVRPKGGCTGFIEVLVPGINLNEVAELLVHNHGVLILPGDVNFPITDACENNIKNHFRVGFARKNFPEVLARFEECFVSVLEAHGVSDVKGKYWD